MAHIHLVKARSRCGRSSCGLPSASHWSARSSTGSGRAGSSRVRSRSLASARRRASRSSSYIPAWGGIHVNLTGLVGLLAGPLLGALIALVVDVFSAALGRGAVGLPGANTLVNALEAIVAYYGFRTLLRMDRGTFPASTATLGLSAGAVLMGAIIVIGGVNGSTPPRGDQTIAVMGLVGLNLGIAVIEGVLTGFVVQFLASVRPDLVGLVDRDAREESVG